MKACFPMSFLAASLGLALLFPVVGDAGGKKKTKPGGEQADAQKAAAQENYIQDLNVAYRLKEIGMDKSAPAPEALVAAARILRRLAGVPLGTLDVKPTIESKDDAKLDKVNDSPDLLKEAEGLLIEARKRGEAQNLNLDKLIDEVEGSKTRGAFGGPRNINRSIGGNDTHVYHIPFANHLPSCVGFQASIPIRVTVVRSGSDAVVAVGINTRGVCNWHPSGPNSGSPNTGAPIGYTIRVQNVSSTPATYRLFTN
jgi:hypothetical protein